ncbi:MAG: hypothetical protein KBS44_04560 [Clostridiales bacterium]|nr:hypothetical protein [Candidatus Coliplasma equi]
MKKTGKILIIIGAAMLCAAIVFGFFIAKVMNSASTQVIGIIGGAEDSTANLIYGVLFENPLFIFGSLLVTLGTPTLIAGIILLILDKKKEKELQKALEEATAAKLARRKAADADTTDARSDAPANTDDTNADAQPDTADTPDENPENA